MQFIRSLIFNICLYSGLIIIFILAIPTLVLPDKCTIFFGRLSNFINSELYGKVTEVPWSVTFVQVDNLSRHPSQLYEAIFEGIILFILLLYFRNKNFLTKPGLISGLFLIFYSIFRFCIEFFRVPDEQIGYLIFNLSMGQIISLLFRFSITESIFSSMYFGLKSYFEILSCMKSLVILFKFIGIIYSSSTVL